MRIWFVFRDTWPAATRVLSRGRERTPGTSLFSRSISRYIPGFCLTNRFYVAVRLFSRSEMTSKCSKNKKVAHEAIAESITDVLTTFWRLLSSITEQTHINMESICWLYGRRALNSMSSSVFVNQKHVTIQYSYLIRLGMCEDRFPTNARMIDCTIERKKSMWRLVTINLSVHVDSRVVKPVNVRKRNLLTETDKKMRIY